nr:Gag-Pol polyprotein, putative [Tanacetum cinerariifolium]
MLVEEFTNEFDRLRICCDVVEEEKETIARYLAGLNPKSLMLFVFNDIGHIMIFFFPGLRSRDLASLYGLIMVLTHWRRHLDEVSYAHIYLDALDDHEVEEVEWGHRLLCVMGMFEIDRDVVEDYALVFFRQR